MVLSAAVSDIGSRASRISDCCALSIMQGMPNACCLPLLLGILRHLSGLASWPRRLSCHTLAIRWFSARQVILSMFNKLAALHLPDRGWREDTPLTICIPPITMRLEDAITGQWVLTDRDNIYFFTRWITTPCGWSEVVLSLRNTQYGTGWQLTKQHEQWIQLKIRKSYLNDRRLETI